VLSKTVRKSSLWMTGADFESGVLWKKFEQVFELAKTLPTKGFWDALGGSLRLRGESDLRDESFDG
jgi:hypothetical protein